MSNAVRNYMRQNAAAIAERTSGKVVLYGAEGGYSRPQSELAKSVVARAIERHCRNPGTPTILRLSLIEAAAFSTYKINPNALPLFWLAVVSDEAGQCAFGIAQEGDPALSPQVTRTYARASAQRIACEVLVRIAQGIGKAAGSA